MPVALSVPTMQNVDDAHDTAVAVPTSVLMFSEPRKCTAGQGMYEPDTSAMTEMLLAEPLMNAMCPSSSGRTMTILATVWCAVKFRLDVKGLSSAWRLTVR